MLNSVQFNIHSRNIKTSAETKKLDLERGRVVVAKKP